MKTVKLVLAGALLALAVSVAAQAPGGGPGGGGGPSPQMQKYLAQNKYKMQMRQQIRAINEINRNPATALQPAQARQLLAILRPWTAKPKMTEEDAKGIMRSVKKVMTARQLTAMGNVKPQRMGGGRRPGGPGGGPGGFSGRPPGGGPGGPRAGGGPGGRRFDPSRMKDVNFLSTKPDPNNPRSSRRVEGNKRMIAMLEARARGGSATAKR